MKLRKFNVFGIQRSTHFYYCFILLHKQNLSYFVFPQSAATLFKYQCGNSYLMLNKYVCTQGTGDYQYTRGCTINEFPAKFQNAFCLIPCISTDLNSSYLGNISMLFLHFIRWGNIYIGNHENIPLAAVLYFVVIHCNSHPISKHTYLY